VRPHNESIFKTKLPLKFEDYYKHPADRYPDAAPYTNEYFIKIMKDEFKVDVSNPAVAMQDSSSKIQDALIKSWDYFKEKSLELED